MLLGNYISGTNNPIRRSLALAIPLALMFAWAGCFVGCAENLSGDHSIEHAKEFESGTEVYLIDAETSDDCKVSSNKIVIQERQNLKTPATAVVSAASFAPVPKIFRRNIDLNEIPENPPRLSQNKVLFVQHCSFLI